MWFILFHRTRPKVRGKTVNVGAAFARGNQPLAKADVKLRLGELRQFRRLIRRTFPNVMYLG